MVHFSNLELEQRLTLKMNQELSRQLDEIIVKMQAIAQEFKIEQVKEKSPFKNVLAVATEPTSSLEAIKNYIRYQVGRKDASKIWKLSQLDEGGKKKLFAERVVEQINSLGGNFKQAFNSVQSSLTKDLEDVEKKLELTKKMEALEEKTENFISHPSRNDIDKNSSAKEAILLLLEYMQKNEDRLRQSIHLNLAQLYLGYLSREHTARLGFQGQDN